MSRLEKSFLFASIAVSIAPLAFHWFPADYFSMQTYFFLGLTLLPTLLWCASIWLGRNEKWFRRMSLLIWSLALVSLIYALAISNSDAWAPVVWVVFSQIWFGVSMLMLFVAAAIHLIRRRARTPPKIRQTRA
jgi:hypothetical protein